MTPKKPKWSIISAIIIWPQSAKTTVIADPSNGRSKMFEVTKSTPSAPPVNTHQGIRPTPLSWNVKRRSTTKQIIVSKVVPTKNDINDATKGELTVSRN